MKSLNFFENCSRKDAALQRRAIAPRLCSPEHCSNSHSGRLVFNKQNLNEQIISVRSDPNATSMLIEKLDLGYDSLAASGSTLDHRSSGRRPVRFATRASILGPISSPP